jgi:sugar-phosphatase
VPDVLVTADEVENGKPDPAGYLHAASLLGVDPAHSVVLEDAPAGVEAGVAAGMTVIAVLTTNSESALRSAHSRVPDLAALLPERSTASVRRRSRQRPVKAAQAAGPAVAPCD